MTQVVDSHQTQQVLISGASGLLGTALSRALRDQDVQVVPMTRSASGSGGRVVVWDPSAGKLDPADLEGMDAVVHLAGESIAAARWTAKKKRRIRDSRVNGTALLSEAIATLQRKPRVLICASAAGIYGSRGDEVLDESSAAGESFLATVCQQWEAACEPARRAGVRVVNVRFGMVLSGDGGALKAMLTPFRLGLGGAVGSGEQWWSWISLDDAVRAIEFVMQQEAMVGPVNVVSPEPVTNRQFTKALGCVLRRPTILPLPGQAARLLMGEMADELLLASARITPQRLKQAGFTFNQPQLESALRAAVGGT